MLPILLLIVVAYFVGAIPFGYLVGKAKGIDVRKAGSGNIGATNVGRLLGKRFFWGVFVLDTAKGALPMLAGAYLVSALPESSTKYALWLSTGLAAMLGHLFPVYLGFKGGKGVATSLGLMLGVVPYYSLAAVPGVLTFLAVFKASRIISLSSIVGAALFPVYLAAFGWMLGWDLLGHRWPLLAFAVAVSLLVILRHRSNIARLRAGTEPQYTSRKSAATDPSAPTPTTSVVPTATSTSTASPPTDPTSTATPAPPTR